MAGSEHKPFVRHVVDRARFWINEPDAQAKYDDDAMMEVVRMVASETMQELTSVAENPITVRHTITIDNDAPLHMLPPYISEVTRIAYFNTDSDRPETVIEPRSRWNPRGPGIEFVGQGMLRVQPELLEDTETIDVEFVPSGEMRPAAWIDRDFSSHIDTATSVVRLSPSPDLGTFDRRPNAYVGCILRVYDGPLPPNAAVFPITERLITAYDISTLSCTLKPALPTDWVDGPYSFEVVPVMGSDFVDMVTIKAAMFVLGFEAPDRVAPLNMQYQRLKRTLLLRWSNYQSIVGRSWERSTSWNDYYMTGVPA